MKRRTRNVIFSGLGAALILAGALWQAGGFEPASNRILPAVAAAPEGVQLYPADATADNWTGKLVRSKNENFAILSVRGTPEQRGTAHGKLLGREVRAVVDGVKKYLRAEDEYVECISGTKVMREHVEKDVIAELDACAAAAEVDKDDLLLAQLFGDVARAKKIRTFCSAFAAFGPATKDGKLVVGRNFDYAGFGLEEGTPIILHEIPAGENAGRPFVTIGYAGILNGWTAMNADGLCASNNTLFQGVDAMEGMSTCFLLRKIVERARTVEEGVAILENTPRACTTGMLIAGKNAKGGWDARFVEFDAKSLAVVEPTDGVVLSTNSRQKLPTPDGWKPGEPSCSRFQALKRKLNELRGSLSFDERKHDVIAHSGVYMAINLHCAILDPVGQRIRLAVKASPEGKPAAEEAFSDFHVRPDGVERLLK